MSNLIIITGCPGTGKSFFAHVLSAHFPQLTLLSYDQYKEKAWDLYGFNNVEEKNILNQHSLHEFYADLLEQLLKGNSVLIEYPFNKSHVFELQRIIQKSRAHAFTLYLYGDMETMYQRTIARDQHDMRHPGHLYNVYHKGKSSPPTENCQPTLEAFVDSCNQKDYNIRLGNNIPVDVTHLDKIPYENIIQKLQSCTGLENRPTLQGGTQQ